MVLWALATSTAWAGLYSQIIVFGDSLSDVGNEHDKWGNVTDPDHEFRNSNGPLWVDNLAAAYGAPALTCSRLGGTNYAYGGAETTYDGYVPNLPQQVTAFKNDLGTNAADPNALYIVWMGSNDFLKTYCERGGSLDPADTQVWRDAISGAVSDLHAVGAHQFLVPNLVPLANTPLMSFLGDYKGMFNDIVSDFNTRLFQDLTSLDAAHSDMSIQLFDTYSLLTTVLAHPADYGFTNTSEPATEINPVTKKERIKIDPKTGQPINVDEYLFWDDVHPTAHGHQVLAGALVPEPSAVVMVIAGSLALLGWARMRRR